MPASTRPTVRRRAGERIRIGAVASHRGLNVRVKGSVARRRCRQLLEAGPCVHWQALPDHRARRWCGRANAARGPDERLRRAECSAMSARCDTQRADGATPRVHYLRLSKPEAKLPAFPGPRRRHSQFEPNCHHPSPSRITNTSFQLYNSATLDECCPAPAL